ncbi:hypothetical protein ABIE44_003003 [Marmoricola sp. OAE513]|uniref:hypothetical protein n=1 Tax=Marmoricola sp. OAE513 TaxID=2817894 RepID=UPI001AE2DB72
MADVQITRSMFERSVHIIEASGILDLICPEPPPSQKGRRGSLRQNTHIWLVGVILCTRIGQETTTAKIHQTLTQNLPREFQLELGVIRPLTTTAPRLPADYDPEKPRLTRNGKQRKEIWVEDGYERVGYDDLAKVVTAFRKKLDYGHGTAPDLTDQEREQRRTKVESIVDALIGTTVLTRSGSTVAIDGTGIWAWNRGPSKDRAAVVKKLKDGTARHASEDGESDDSGVADPDLQVAGIGIDEDGNTAPVEVPVALRAAAGRADDAEWGYKTGKDGKSEAGYGFHQHTIVRTADPNQPKDSEPLQVEGLICVPANEDVVTASLRMIDRASERSKITRVIGDLLYTNLKADRWAAPLAERGIEQVLAMRSDSAGLVLVHGAIMQFGWMHCPSAPMDQRPLPATFARDETEDHYEAVEAFQDHWAFDRKETGLLKNLASKWMCPAMVGKAVCFARDPEQFEANKLMENPLPSIVPPDDWKTRKCCTNKTIDFTPDPGNSHHQRKLMQRWYYGSRAWRRAFNLRSYVEGAFGILKNPSRLRIRRGHNRIPGLATINILNSLKVALFNEEQARAWYERQLINPKGVDVTHLTDHPLLQADPYDWGVTTLSKDEAKAMDRNYLFGTQDTGHVLPNQPTNPDAGQEGNLAA